MIFGFKCGVGGGKVCLFWTQLAPRLGQTPAIVFFLLINMTKKYTDYKNPVQLRKKYFMAFKIIYLRRNMNILIY